jgi:hypothetical protein
MHDAASYLNTAALILSSIVIALIGYSLNAKMETLRAEFNLALSAAEVRFFDLVNGKYVRKDILDLRLAAMMCSGCASAIANANFRAKSNAA